MKTIDIKETQLTIMNLTENALEHFETWYIPYIREKRSDYYKFSDDQLLRKFHRMIPSMKFGVFTDWFTTSEAMMLIEYSVYNGEVKIVDYDHAIEEQVHLFDMTYEFEDSTDYKTDYELFAVNEANKIYNKRK